MLRVIGVIAGYLVRVWKFVGTELLDAADTLERATRERHQTRLRKAPATAPRPASDRDLLTIGESPTASSVFVVQGRSEGRATRTHGALGCSGALGRLGALGTLEIHLLIVRLHRRLELFGLLRLVFVEIIGISGVGVVDDGEDAVEPEGRHFLFVAGAHEPFDGEREELV